MEKICALMRNDDAKFQEVKNTNAIGSAAFLNAVESHADILYAQRHGGGGQPRDAPSTTRWKASATFYCCGANGHIKTECKLLSNVNFARRMDIRNQYVESSSATKLMSH